jgi:hypothetical protein
VVCDDERPRQPRPRALFQCAKRALDRCGLASSTTLFRRNPDLYSIKVGVVLIMIVALIVCCFAWLTNVVGRGADAHQCQALKRVLHNPKGLGSRWCFGEACSEPKQTGPRHGDREFIALMRARGSATQLRCWVHLVLVKPRIESFFPLTTVGVRPLPGT